MLLSKAQGDPRGRPACIGVFGPEAFNR